eukprot:5045997-Pyramimonas_sp.AAC.2
MFQGLVGARLLRSPGLRCRAGRPPTTGEATPAGRRLRSILAEILGRWASICLPRRAPCLPRR